VHLLLKGIASTNKWATLKDNMKILYNQLHKSIAARLTIARIKAQMSQSLVAERLNIPRPSVSEIESGKRKVTAEELIVLASLYDVSLDWLAEAENVEEIAKLLEGADEEKKLMVAKLLRTVLRLKLRHVDED